MANQVLIFTSETNAQAALAQVWRNYVNAKIKEGYSMIGSNNIYYDKSVIDGMSNTELSLLNILCGKNPQNDIITAYDEIHKAHDIALWYFDLPESQYMEGVTGYVLSGFDSSWLEPENV